MFAENQALHPSLLRYLPGHVSKRQKRTCTGKTNKSAYDNAHVLNVQTQVAQQLTLPDKITQTLLPSRTVTRVALLPNHETQMGSIENIQNYFPNTCYLSDGQINTMAKEKNNRAHIDEGIATMSLIASNTKGKDHAYNGETFFLGYRHIGGAGQLEYNNPADPHARTPVISHWKTRHHFRPEVWHSGSLQNLSVAAKDTQLPTNSTSPKSTAHLEEGKPDDAALERKSHKKVDSPTTIHQQTEEVVGHASKNPMNWINNYVPPDMYDVPLPKLRFGRTDYRSTFHNTQALPTSTMYINEKERFCTTNNVPLYTPSILSLKKKGRRQYKKQQ